MSLQPHAVPTREIHTVLVANRGEIARRVIRTVHALGLTAVAVYSDADADAAHVREADVAVRLGPAPASESYLDLDAVLAAASATGADAVHPGYGFLSENAAFGRALAEAGIAFIGPGEEALAVMGDKITAKNHVAAAGVPVTPGIAEAGLDDAALVAGAGGVGFPLLIKPSAGGGGQGMVEVHDAAELPGALASARRTARTAFGDDTLFLERLITNPRHIEVQLLADKHGTTVHLGERECSLQRRHQKVIEEAPAPLLLAQPDGGAALRARLGEAAVNAARSVGYVGAGTVEFLVSDDRPDEFFFMEMNTRLQVEHPVTEEVVRVRGERLDLVAWQIRIAAGEALDFTQDEVRLTGHAAEARVYAERPEENFLPAVGAVRAVSFPRGEGLRVDAALDGPGEVSAFYDPMIAKVIAFGPDRGVALDRLDAALADTLIAGAGSNVGYLRALLADPDVRAGRLDTGLIARRPELTRAPAPEPRLVAALAAAAAVLEIRAGSGAQALEPIVPAAQPGTAPGWTPDGWRAGGVGQAGVHVLLELPDGAASGAVTPRPGGAEGEFGDVEWRGQHAARHGASTEQELVLHASTGGIGRSAARATLVHTGGDRPELWIHGLGQTLHATAVLRAARQREALAERGVAATGGDPRAIAPMTGTVATIGVRDGELVEAGAALVAIEAMKMEHPVTAPIAGRVRLAAGVAVGSQVNQGQIVAVIEAEAEPETPAAAPEAS
ncbi:ATP-binding protein [Galactobacter valiniphilus]|uniref:ATP-binding protein n=1 Tax=Galactobacter valiniphilus TaxID=2676122 RepID=UPI001F39B7BA|nr:biotin carboxylase N-terminal domain-containing protein [Galactobacter valiniphilus]